MPHMRCEECGYAWSGPEDMPLSRCPQCGRSDKLVEVADEPQPTAEQEPSGQVEATGFTASTELAMVAAIILLVLILAASIVTLFFAVSGAL